MHKKSHKSVWALPPSVRSIGARLVMVSARAQRYLTHRRLLIGGGISIALLVCGMAVSFFWPRSVTFSYADNNCFNHPVLLPNLVSAKDGSVYTAKPVASVSVVGLPLFARTTCVTPKTAPIENTVEVISFGNTLFKKNISVSSTSFPAVTNQDTLEAPVPTREPLVLQLSEADRIFDYQLKVNEAVLPCTKQDSSVTCDLAALSLAQSASYTFELQRLFEGKVAGAVFTRPVTTVESVSVLASSIAADQTVHDVPTEMTLTLNRSATTMDGAHLYLVSGDTRQEVPIQASLNDKTVTVRFEQPLARSASFVLEIQNIAAQDGGFLASPLSLNFKTSGGPKALGLNIGSSKVSTSTNIIITFDAPVSTTQALGNFIKLDADGSQVAANLSVSGNKVTIKPTSSLPRCTALTITISDGLQNTYGIAGGSARQFKSRTICQHVFSIGSSVLGRSITAYSFGSGPSKVIFVGTTHGDEKSSTATLNSFVDYLESNAGSIPAHRTVVVIPNLNPDGYAASRRTNANNVDLNRNFPANDWKQGVTMPDGSFNPNGGGSAPLSEPESAALASYVLAQNPRLVLTYHAAAGVVIPNDSDDSDGLAHVYDQKSNLRYAANSQTGAIFDYDTTGSFEDWLHHKHGVPTLLIELWTKSSNEFSKNQNAMWHMVQLP